MFGQEIPRPMAMNTSLLSFIYDKITHQWTDLSQNFPCMEPINMDKYTCAYLRPRKAIVMSVRDCNPILNLTLYPNSWSWTSIMAPHNNGIVFNTDEYEENLIFIGNATNKTQSELYAVSAQTINQGWTYIRTLNLTVDLDNFLFASKIIELEK